MIGRSAVLVVCLVALGVAVAGWVRLGLPQPLAPATQERIPCVSYAPFRDRETPFDADFTVPPERIAEDLRHLSTLTGCVRTYATDNGLEHVPAAAQALGMTVLQGAWIGRDPVNNRRQIDSAVDLANRFPDTVRAVIVGNEVLLRREQLPAPLTAMAREVRARVPAAVAVTYADVWEFWVQYPQMAEAVDFITVHMLPYWEDEPAGVDIAIDHIAAAYHAVSTQFPGRRLLIGETGWPSAGRQREDAVASQLAQTTFVRHMLDRAGAEGWDINLIESFDQPWKRGQEGTVGGFWGLFANDRTAKVSLRGPVVEEPAWALYLAGGLAGGVGLAMLAAMALGGRRSGALGWAVAMAGSLAAGVTLAYTARYMLASSRAWYEWAYNGVGLGVAAVTAAALAAALGRQLGGEGRGLAAPAVLAGLRRAVLVMAGLSAAGLVFAPRYRDFPATLIVVAAVGFLLLWLRHGGRDILPRAPEDRWLAVAVGFGGLFCAANEGWRNDAALAWSASALVLALPLLLSEGRARRFSRTR